ncbi:MAG: ISL3 family transposase, partial [Anaerobutyricum hallii]|nr:ISL3 family transposase [Anaerobutyricum hallii]
KKSDLFNLPEIKAIGGWNDKFDLLIKENELLFKADLIKEKITAAYQEDHEWKMAKQIIEIIDL